MSDLFAETVRSGTMSSSGEVVVVLIGLMLQTLMSQMGGSAITPQDVIRRVTAQGNAAGIRLGEVFSCAVNMLLCVFLRYLFVLVTSVQRNDGEHAECEQPGVVFEQTDDGHHSCGSFVFAATEAQHVGT